MDFRQVFREKVQEPLEELQERARQQWISLNPRERMIVSLLAGVMTFLLAVLVIKEAFTFFSRHEDQMAENITNISEIQKISGELSQQRMQLSQFERLKGRRGENFKIAAFLETESRKYNVTLEKVSPTKSRSKEDGDEEEWVEVRLSKETRLDPALRFLRATEEALGVRIVDLQVKPDFADATKLEITATVAAKKEI